MLQVDTQKEKTKNKKSVPLLKRDKNKTIMGVRRGLLLQLYWYKVPVFRILKYYFMEVR